ncbi:MAG: hypothetical protein ACLRVN_07945, partial [Butyricicoccus sp.]
MGLSISIILKPSLVQAGGGTPPAKMFAYGDEDHGDYLEYSSTMSCSSMSKSMSARSGSFVTL